MHLLVYRGDELEELLVLLEQYQGKASIVAGGTDIILRLREKELKPEILLDISSIKELKGISEFRSEAAGAKKDGLVENALVKTRIAIGAAVTFSEIAKSPLFKLNLRGLADAASSVGSPQIRNAATIGGNICNASPAADILPPLLALDASVAVKSSDEELVLPLHRFLLDKGKVRLQPNQLLYSVVFERPKQNQSLGFAKLGLRKALAISRIAVAVFVETENNCFATVRVATGACGRIPLRETTIETQLAGRDINDKSIEAAAERYKMVLEERLEGRNAAEYKSEAVKGVFKEAITRALSYQNL